MVLTDVTICNAKPKQKSYKLSDGFGLHVIIKPTGSKLWYQKYRFDGKEKRLAHGAYPIVSLSDACKLCESAKTLLNHGKFFSCLKVMRTTILRVIETYLLPTLKDRLLIDLKTQDLLIALKVVESKAILIRSFALNTA